MPDLQKIITAAVKLEFMRDTIDRLYQNKRLFTRVISALIPLTAFFYKTERKVDKMERKNNNNPETNMNKKNQKANENKNENKNENSNRNENKKDCPRKF